MKGFEKKLCALLLAVLLLWTTAQAVWLDEDGYPFVIRNGSRDEKRVALTFDDCYYIEAVRQVFELSQELGFRFTIFPLGCVLKEEDGDLWRAIVDAGNELGTHTYFHNALGEQNARSILTSLGRSQQRTDEVLGYHYPLMSVRPPYGNITGPHGNTSTTFDTVRKYGFRHVINWDVSQTDAARAVNQTQNGSILLFHVNPQDLKCIRELVPQLQQRGYELTTVHELLGFESPATSTDLYIYDYKAFE